MKLWPCLLLLTGCGASWADSDTTAATGVAKTQLLVESICADGQPCTPAQVRALERSSYCLSASMLYRHNLPVPDGGIQCQP
jgi:hypothetical protein